MNRRFGSRHFYLLLAAGGLLVLVGLGAAHYMEENGHIVTGMNNQVVWGLPHVFAIFLIVAASGVLNVASIGSVFGQAIYKPRARLSGLLCIAMLAGGMMVLMLDLGRPERVIVAATHYNLHSVFAWNVFLYSGMFAIVALYLWTMFERPMNRHTKTVGILALAWRFVLTTGTGSIFGFLVARQAYGSAMLAPLFIMLSFAWGLAVFLIVQSALYAWQGEALDDTAQRSMARLLGVFVAAAFYFVLVLHLTSLYFAKQSAFQAFILRDGGVFPLLLWGGYLVFGTLVPLLMLFHPRFGGPRSTLLASTLVALGALAWLYVFIIGGQAFPLDIFPGFSASSTFADGTIASYTPRLAEWLLGLGGIAVAFVLTAVGVRVLDFMPHDDLASLKPGIDKGAA